MGLPSGNIGVINRVNSGKPKLAWHKKCQHGNPERSPDGNIGKRAETKVEPKSKFPLIPTIEKEGKLFDMVIIPASARHPVAYGMKR